MSVEWPKASRSRAAERAVFESIPSRLTDPPKHIAGGGQAFAGPSRDHQPQPGTQDSAVPPRIPFPRLVDLLDGRLSRDVDHLRCRSPPGGNCSSFFMYFTSPAETRPISRMPI